MRWRRLLRAVHRDLGYLAVGLTLVYAISGVAVNHVEDWNPSWRVDPVEERFEPLPVTDRDTLVRQLVDVLDLPGPPRESFRTAPHEVLLFYDGWTVEADVRAGVARVERPRPRFLLRELNRLHLDEPGGWWTWVADAYAVGLAALALTGAVLLPGRKGLAGRGGVLVALGVAIPVVAVLLSR